MVTLACVLQFPSNSSTQFFFFFCETCVSRRRKRGFPCFAMSIPSATVKRRKFMTREEINVFYYANSLFLRAFDTRPSRVSQRRDLYASNLSISEFQTDIGEQECHFIGLLTPWTLAWTAILCCNSLSIRYTFIESNNIKDQLEKERAGKTDQNTILRWNKLE